VGLFGTLFSKSPADYLAKGDKHMEAGSFFDARTCYEDGLGLKAKSGDDLSDVFKTRITEANRKLAELNISEAEHAYARGDVLRAQDHLELVKTLTYDVVLREKAEQLLRSFQTHEEIPPPAHHHSGCGSCGGGGGADSSDSVIDDSLPLMEYFELLVHQLPEQESRRYVGLGEDFAYAYVAASRDEHSEALAALEKCASDLPEDIYQYEKGKLLHRLGDDIAAEKSLRCATELNETNSLAWLALALFLRDTGNFHDALDVAGTMIVKHIMPEQALYVRAEIFEAVGDHETAINNYVELLNTSMARTAAEHLYGLLMEMGRHDDAATVFKKYLNKSCH
jgi:tetratricopeptide (TPR) repeat protein